MSSLPRMSSLLRLVAAVALCAYRLGEGAAPPCYNPLNADYETLCYTVAAQSGNVTIRDIGVGLNGTLLTGMSASTTFETGSVDSATPVFDYFLRDNGEFVTVPLTVPLIFRPDEAGTWLASFALPTSVYPSEATAPSIVSGSDLLFEQFSPSTAPQAGRLIAAYTFYTIQMATQDDYSAACASLMAALPSMGVTPVDGAWREAWVTYSTESIVGDRINECWFEVSNTTSM